MSLGYSKKDLQWLNFMANYYDLELGIDRNLILNLVKLRLMQHPNTYNIMTNSKNPRVIANKIIENMHIPLLYQEPVLLINEDTYKIENRSLNITQQIFFNPNNTVTPSKLFEKIKAFNGYSGDYINNITLVDYMDIYPVYEISISNDEN